MLGIILKKVKSLPAHKDETGHIIVPEKKDSDLNKTAIYTRVSSNENKKNLESQAERPKEYMKLKINQANTAWMSQFRPWLTYHKILA